MPKVIQQLNFVLHRGHGEKISDPDFLSQNDPLKNKSKGSRCSFIGKQKFIRSTGFISVFTLLILTFLTIFPIVPKLDSAEGATEEGDSETLLTITSGKGSSNLVLEASSSTGTFAQSSDEDMATFTVTTTNFTGYTLNLSGNESDLISTEASNSISSISNNISSDDFENSSDYNNQWGYQVNLLDTTATSSAGKNVYNTPNDGNFLPAPAIADPDNKEVSLNITSDANGSTKHPDPLDTYAIRLGARIDYTVPTGIYTNTFTIAAVANPVSYTISYNDTTGDSTVTGSPINPKVITTGQTPTDIGDTTINATLYNDGVPTRTGYTFNKWCYGTVTHTTGSASTCNGTEYAKGASFTINRTIDNSDIVLYAMWTPNTYTITYGTVNGISSVSLNGTACSTALSSGGCTKTLTYANTYNLSATASTGYSFSSWNAGSYGKVNSTSSASTTYTTGTGNSTITPAATINTYNVKVNFAGSGVSSVVFSASGYTTRTVSSSGGTANLTYGVRYTVQMNFSSTSYGFSSWALNSSSHGTLSSTTSNPTYFTPNASSSSAIITATGKTLKTYMQNLSSSECTTSYRTVYDNRDEQSYVIQRLADGKCWMMTNLNLGAVTLIKDLTSSNTNISSTITASTFNGWKKTSNTNTFTSPVYIPISGNDSDNGLPYGTAYNYCAASGRTICTDSNSSNANYDLCPAGWRLPTGGSTSASANEFNNLYKLTNYNTYAKMRASYISGGAAFTLAGRFNGANNPPAYQGAYGIYWSSTRKDNTSMYILDFVASKASVAMDSNYNRKNGPTIRCVLK